MNEPKIALRLVAPDWAVLDSIWLNPAPFILWYIGNQTLLCHWMDEAVRRGVEEVEIYVADRPAEVRAWLDEGTFWSRRIKVIPIGREGDAPADAERITGLPGEVPLAADPADASALLRYWFELQKKWLAQRMSAPAQLDQVHASGGWVGPRAVISPAATLAPPFWIGADKMKDQLLEKNEMAGGVTFKMKNDPRVTRVGRFIRK